MQGLGKVSVLFVIGTAALVSASPGAFGAVPKPAASDPEAVVSLKLEPSSLTFLNKRDGRRVVVSGIRRDGTAVDLTPVARYTLPTGLLTRDRDGYFLPAKTGRGSVTVAAGGLTAPLAINVRSVAPAPISYMRDVQPILSKAGCTAGTCHGSAKGKNGFKLSLRGYDPEWDYHALVDDVNGRRVNRAAPDQSLMLLKPSQLVPHQGGLVFDQNSRHYDIIKRWIAEGVKYDVDHVGRVSKVEVLPRNPTMPLSHMKQTLLVIAHYPDGTNRDVTRDARFTSSVPEIAEVTDAGVVSSIRRGESAVQVVYEGQYATGEFTVLGDRTGWKWAKRPELNFIDKLVDAKLMRVKSQAAPLCSDSDFLRRAYLDLIGLPPAPEVSRAYLEDNRESTVKRAELIDRLLQSPEFDDHWTYKFADLLEVNRKYLGDKGVQAFRAWIHDAIASNKPYDQFVRELLTATGDAFTNPATNYMRVQRDTSLATENVTQLFLGVRFSCNKCHDHPFERWTQNQYYQFGAFFAQVGYKPDTAGEEAVYDRGTGEIQHPKTGNSVSPAFPVSYTGSPANLQDRREALAAWVTSPKNPFFARSMANRVWSYFLGRGIIDPVDDIRNSNPPSNGPLLEALTDEFVKSGFDLRHLMKLIVSSRVYQSSISTNHWNLDDHVNFSHQVARRLPAEQLLDTITLATGAPQNYQGVPKGTLAQQLPDTKVASGGFLDLFGRPARESPCECERTSEVSLAQALNLMNGATISEAISNPEGRVTNLVKTVPDDGRLIEEVYLSTMCRLPTAIESATALKHIRTATNRLEGAQDLMWALINSPAFLFNR